MLTQHNALHTNKSFDRAAQNLNNNNNMVQRGQWREDEALFSFSLSLLKVFIKGNKYFFEVSSVKKHLT